MNFYKRSSFLDVDTREYGYVDQTPMQYNFRAICTSEVCAKRSKAKIKNGDLGTIKRVDRKEDYCPQCGYALFWDKVAK